MIAVDLSEGEQKHARLMGQHRMSVAGGKGVVDRLESTRPPHIIETNGSAGELAFGKHFNYWVDLCFGVTGVPDFRLRDKRTLDVKTSHYPNGNLIVRKQINHSELYYLVTGDYTKNSWTYILHGCLRYEEAIDEKYFKKDSYWVPQGDLKELSDTNQVTEGYTL